MIHDLSEGLEDAPHPPASTTGVSPSEPPPLASTSASPSTPGASSLPARSPPRPLARSSGSRLTFFLDGAHTPESMATCADWFAGVAEGHVRGEGGGVRVRGRGSGVRGQVSGEVGVTVQI